jgi:hypothetical protein
MNCPYATGIHVCICVAWFPKCFFPHVVSAVGPIVCGPDRSMSPTQSRGTASANTCLCVILRCLLAGRNRQPSPGQLRWFVDPGRKTTHESDGFILCHGWPAAANNFGNISQRLLSDKRRHANGGSMWVLRGNTITDSAGVFRSPFAVDSRTIHSGHFNPLSWEWPASLIRAFFVGCLSGLLLWVTFASCFCESRVSCVLLNLVIIILLIVSQQHRSQWSGV